MQAEQRKLLKSILDRLRATNPSQIMWMISAAIIVATYCHHGQRDKNSNPYILHPLHVGMMCKNWMAKTAGFLHDIVEDTDCTLQDLEYFGFDRSVLEAVRLLTKDNKIEYEAYIEQLAKNSHALEVKIEDITHNTAPQRNLFPRNKATMTRLTKYGRALAYLLHKKWD